MATKLRESGVGLALSGGAARGIAHAGVLEVLVEADESDEFDSSDDDSLMLGMSPDVQGHGWEAYRSEVTHASQGR